MNILLAPPARLFAWIARLRAERYDQGVLEIVDTGLPVVSIGNLTAGGTGKTPITSFFVRDFAKRGVTCAIVSRGYGGSEKGPALVPTRAALSTGGVASRLSTGAVIEATARMYGDEPAWLANEHPETPVVIGARRPEAVKFLREQAVSRESGAWRDAKRRIVLADDAFQHRRLKRDLDIVIVDPTEPRWHYKPLPMGRMREGFDALKRAQFVIISKANLAKTEDLDWLRGQLELYNSKFKILEFKVAIKGFTPGRPAGKRVLLASGIARPHTFEQLMKDAGFEPAVHLIYRDHHAFSAQDKQKIESSAKNLKVDAIVVTEKDAVKLGGWSPSIPLVVSRLEAEPITDLGELHAAIDRLV